MKTVLKWFLGLTLIGSAIGLIIAYFCKGECCGEWCSDDYTEEDDFDLDSDLEPTPSRDYVDLQKTKAETTTANTSDEDTGSTSEV